MGKVAHVGITGAAGFIGSHLSRRLLADGVAVSGVDDLSFGSVMNLCTCLNHPRFTFRIADCSSPGGLDAIHGCDALVHLAARKIPRYGGATETLQKNTAAAKAVCNFALERGVKLLMMSTSDVYGNAPLPLAEDGPLVLGPSTSRRWAYAVSKLYGEHLALALAEERGLSVTVVRLFNSYGPNNHRSWWGGPQAAFIEALLDGLPMDVHGDGRQVRSFIFVTDVVEALVCALHTDAARGQVINIGGNEPVTILELANIVQGTVGLAGPARLNFVPYSDFPGSYEDVRARIPDTTKARALLGFEARVALSDGVRQTVAWHRECRSGGLNRSQVRLQSPVHTQR